MACPITVELVKEAYARVGLSPCRNHFETTGACCPITALIGGLSPEGDSYVEKASAMFNVDGEHIWDFIYGVMGVRCSGLCADDSWIKAGRLVGKELFDA